MKFICWDWFYVYNGYVSTGVFVCVWCLFAEQVCDGRLP